MGCRFESCQPHRGLSGGLDHRTVPGERLRELGPQPCFEVLGLALRRRDRDDGGSARKARSHPCTFRELSSFGLPGRQQSLAWRAFPGETLAPVTPARR